MSELHKAAQDGEIEKVKQILDEAFFKEDGESEDLIDDKDKMGDTPLHKAVKAGHIDLAKYLISNGAEINEENKTGWTPLLTASFFGTPQVAELLIAKGADVNAENRNGSTPLHGVASRGLVEVADLLLAKGADPNPANKTGHTPLHVASTKGHYEIVKFLLDHGAKLFSRDNMNRTPLHEAVSGGSKIIVTLLLNRRAKIDDKDNSGNTPLHEACENGYAAIVETLLKRNADITIRNNRGEDAMLIAKRKRNGRIIELINQKIKELRQKAGERGEDPDELGVGKALEEELPEMDFEEKTEESVVPKDIEGEFQDMLADGMEEEPVPAESKPRLSFRIPDTTHVEEVEFTKDRRDLMARILGEETKKEFEKMMPEKKEEPKKLDEAVEKLLQQSSKVKRKTKIEVKIKKEETTAPVDTEEQPMIFDLDDQAVSGGKKGPEVEEDEENLLEFFTGQSADDMFKEYKKDRFKE